VQRLDDPLYPITPARQEGWLPRGAHRVYWSDAGAADGIPVIMAHGGPGGSSSPGYRRFIDPSAWRIVQFDQRGCGRSEPEGLLDDNTLQATITDMEALREHLGIERWVVAGGSWGTTVAVAYAEAHPERCLGLSLVSMWLCRRRDVDWWFHGVRTMFPELWEQFASLVPEAERGDLRKAYCTRILGPDPAIAAEAATRLYQYEEGFMHFDAPFMPADPARGPRYGRIFAHYAANDFFLRDNQLLDDAHRIAQLPTVLITGRYDSCTTPDNAYDLARRLNHADLRIIPAAGHYPTEPAMAYACAAATRDLQHRLRVGPGGGS
jgi:proline iminopeptidase